MRNREAALAELDEGLLALRGVVELLVELDNHNSEKGGSATLLKVVLERLEGCRDSIETTLGERVAA